MTGGQNQIFLTRAMRKDGKSHGAIRMDTKTSLFDNIAKYHRFINLDMIMRRRWRSWMAMLVDKTGGSYGLGALIPDDVALRKASAD